MTVLVTHTIAIIMGASTLRCPATLRKGPPSVVYAVKRNKSRINIEAVRLDALKEESHDHVFERDYRWKS